jgi:hypothetical protein
MDVKIINLYNMTDIEVLRNIAKSYMVQMKRDTEANDGTDNIFKKKILVFLRPGRNRHNGIHRR